MAPPAAGPVLTMDLANSSVAFDTAAFDQAVRAHGCRFVHHRGIWNPVGLVDPYDVRRAEPDHSGASNGRLYTPAGVFAALFTGNSKTVQAQTSGLLDAGVAQITPARCYDCAAGGAPEQVRLMEQDRLYLADEAVLVPTQERVEASPTGRDRLKFPVVRVEVLVDAANERYRQGADFDVVEGQIVWGPRRPGANVMAGRGVVYSVRYQYRPYWYVDRLTHEIRVAQTVDALGRRSMVAMPQCAIINREYVARAEANDPLAPPSARQQPAPADGSYPPR